MNTETKYRKKPVVIEAMRVTPTNVHEAVASNVGALSGPGVAPTFARKDA